jgi:hypothetical protein
MSLLLDTLLTDKSTFMDTPNLPENESEEITWQDDENRATLFLRSVFVVLSGALIWGVYTQPFAGDISTVFRIVILPVVFPALIVWLFFGQGLRPVEWLRDQKYNAWNYGVNFTDGKTHLRWLIPLLILGIVEVIIFKIALVNNPSEFSVINWLLVLLIQWLFGISLAWFIWGYLWFGCAQGFGAIAATAIIIIFICYAFIKNVYPRETAFLVSACFIPLALLCSYICWKQKTWIPILYAVILLAPIASFILIY